MNSADQELAEKVLKEMQHYHEASTRRSWANLPNVRNRHINYVILSFILPIFLVTLAYLVFPLMPPRPAELSAGLACFVIAIALSCILSGREGAWVAASSSLLIIAWVAPPDGSFAIEAAAVPWFILTCVTFATIVMTAPRRPRPPPLTRPKIIPKSPHENIKQRQRRFVVGDRMTIPFPR